MCNRTHTDVETSVAVAAALVVFAVCNVTYVWYRVVKRGGSYLMSSDVSSNDAVLHEQLVPEGDKLLPDTPPIIHVHA